jgi:hypothetical protein
MKKINQSSDLSRRGLLKSIGALSLTLPASSVLANLLAKAPKWDPKLELAIQLDIATQKEVRVHRPYVAIWIEDKDGKPVRTISLWVQTTRRGPKWIPDLRRWYRGEQDRAKANGGDLVATTSSATREAGHYTIVWDGKNDKGAYVEQGEYYICIEAAREHGTYQLIREKAKFVNKAFTQKFSGNVEISGASIELRKRS